MPAKINTICYVHNLTERVTQEFVIREITAIARVSEENPTQISFLRIKAFVPVDPSRESNIDDVDVGDVVYIKGKFVGCPNWYSVNATYIKVINIEYENMPVVGLNVMLTGITTQVVRNVDENSVLDFYVEERIGDRDPNDFWVECRHNSNNTYLSNKTNAINQNMATTTAILVGTMFYEPPSNEESGEPGKHVLKLDDISLVTSPQGGRANNQTMNLPWLNPQRSPSRTARAARGASPRTPRRNRATLARMSATNRSLDATLQANPVIPIPPPSEAENTTDQ